MLPPAYSDSDYSDDDILVGAGNPNRLPMTSKEENSHSDSESDY